MTSTPYSTSLDGLIETADYLIDSYMRRSRGQVVRDLVEAEGAYEAAKDFARYQALTAVGGWQDINSAPFDTVVEVRRTDDLPRQAGGRGVHG